METNFISRIKLKTIFFCFLGFLLFFIPNSLNALTLRTWDGGGGTNDFNTAANWSGDILPSSSDSCVITITADKTITLSANITVGALYFAVTGSNVNGKLDVVSYLLTINGNFYTKASSGNTNTDITIDLGASTGGIYVGRDAVLDDGGSYNNWVIADVTSPGIFTFMGNLTIGPYARTSPTIEPDILFNKSGTQTVTINNTQDYFLAEDLSIGSANSPTVTLAGSTSNGFGCYDGTVAINNSSVFNIVNYLIDRLSVGGSFSIASGATLKIGGTADFPANYSTYSLNAASNTYYNGTTQTITNISGGYGNLYIDGSGTKTFASSTMDVNGSLTITAGTLASGNYNLTLAGNWTNNATYTAGTGTVTFDGSGIQTISGSTTSFYNLTTANASVTTFGVATNITNNLTLGGTSTVDANAALNIDGAVTIASSTTFQEGANAHTVAGNWTDNGTFTEEGGTINFDGGTQTISGSSVNFNNFTHSGSGTTTLGAAVDINGNVSLTAGKLAQSTYNMTVAGNWTSTGNYFTEGTGTVTFDGTGASTISGTTASVTSGGSSTIYSDACESSTGWTLNGGTANWVLTTPTGTYSPANDNSASGTKCFKTEAAGTAYGAIKTYILTSPDINLTGYTSTSLSFYLWMNNEGTTSLFDGGFIEVYNGTSWVSATGSVAYDGSISSSYSNPYAGTSAWTYDRTTWTLVTVDISAYDGVSTFKIRFKYGSDSSTGDGGWAVDDLTVTGYSSTTITGEAFNKFETNKTGGGYVQFSSDVWAQTNFTLTSGVTRTGAYTLILGTSSANVTLTGGSSSAYVSAYDNSGTIGYVKQYVNSNAAYSFPIGDATNYTPLTFTLTAGTLSSAYLTIFTKDVKVPGLSSDFTAYLDRYWNVTESGFTTPTYDISYTYVDADLVGSETGMLPIKKSGSTWYKPTGSSFTDGTAQGTGSFNAGTNTLTWTGLSTFSGFGGVPDSPMPLPIALVSFKGEKDGKNNLLTWETSTELNNDFFVVEKTYDGENYEIVGVQNGAGNSNQYLEYSLTDYDVREVINYYRLKQSDFDGKYTFSNVIAIDNRVKVVNKEITMITNILGQEVNEFYRGVVIIIYADGTSVKVVQ